MSNKQIVILNLLVFAMIHLVFEVLTIDNPYGRVSTAPVIGQFFISYWIIQRKLHQKSKIDIIKYTWLVSLCVLGVRIVLGVIFALVMYGLVGKTI